MKGHLPSILPSVALLAATAACTPAMLEFGAGRPQPNSLAFFDPVPHLLVTVAADCTVSSRVVVLPGARRWVRLKPGQGASDLSIAFADGLVANVGQKSDTKVPETIAAVGSLASAAAGVFTANVAGAAAATPKACPVQAHLLPIEGGIVQVAKDKDQLGNLPLRGPN